MYGEKCFREPKVLKAARAGIMNTCTPCKSLLRAGGRGRRQEYEINIMAMATTASAGKWPLNGEEEEEEERTRAECMLHASGDREEWRTKL